MKKIMFFSLLCFIASLNAQQLQVLQSSIDSFRITNEIIKQQVEHKDSDNNREDFYLDFYYRQLGDTVYNTNSLLSMSFFYYPDYDIDFSLGISNRLNGMIRYVIPTWERSWEEEFALEIDRCVNGSSWENASGDLQLMIDLSSPGDQIWVACGEYTPYYPAYTYTHSFKDLSWLSMPWWNFPSHGLHISMEDFIFRISQRMMDECWTNSFVLKPGVKIYGGFSGWENHIEERDIRTNETILWGRMEGRCWDGEWSRHIVIAADCDSTTLLDGFTITNGDAIARGQANHVIVCGKSIDNRCGGGIYNESSQVHYSNLRVTDNYAAYNGGGIYECNASSSLITNTIIHNNTAGFGGGIYFLHGYYPCTDYDWEIGNHDCDYYLPSRSILNTVLISGNKAEYRGGGVYNAASEPVLVNVTIASNLNELTYEKGSGIYNADDHCVDIQSNMKILNSLILHNPGFDDYGDIFNEENAFITHAYSTLYSEQNWNLFELEWYEGYWEQWAFYLDYYYAPLDPNNIPSEDGDFRTSRETNSGNNDLFYRYGGWRVQYDLEGNPRIINQKIDRGAYEKPW